MTGEDSYRLELYNTAGNKVSEFGFDLDYTDLQISGDCVIMNNEQECRIYSTAGVQRYAGNSAGVYPYWCPRPAQGS